MIIVKSWCCRCSVLINRVEWISTWDVCSPTYERIRRNCTDVPEKVPFLHIVACKENDGRQENVEENLRIKYSFGMKARTGVPDDGSCYDAEDETESSFVDEPDPFDFEEPYNENGES